MRKQKGPHMRKWIHTKRWAASNRATCITISTAAILALSACNSLTPNLSMPSLSGFLGDSSGLDTVPAPSTASPPPIAAPLPASGIVLGKGKVRVALILPLSGSGQAGIAANAMKNAAEMALAEFQSPDIQLLVKDDRGSAEGARQAAQSALSEGAELILGPLFATSVQAVGQAAKAGNTPVIAFSTDASSASRGVYLLSFMVEDEVERLVRYAISQNRKSFAALIPDTPYGRVVEAAFQQEVVNRGGRVVALERYSSEAVLPAVMAKIARVAGGSSPSADALFIPDTGDRLTAIGQAMTTADIQTSKVKVMGTGVWNEPRTFKVPPLAGGWFVAPETTGYQYFSQRYRARYNSDPGRLATLSYDAVSLAAALVRTQGAQQRFSDSVLTNSAGFSGVDGVFRFKTDGTNDRALSVFEIKAGGAQIISASPRTLGGGT
jgi:ABC-type branched-subunit amino acid transport system substrate-binding protein